ncbi:C2H2-type zinc finger transcription factor [Rhizophagus irregularis DAOM 181602=DAOM 197198]|nr:C2H2-type zinc finger transcription factor [Rhizophagus irregularis DAOM 181602=DAOM 197198]
MTFTDDKLLAALYYPEYWNRNPASWGSISDWDIYYINQVPGCTFTGRKLKAAALEKSLQNCDKDPANLILWKEHCSNLATLAIEDRVNKREIQIFAVKEVIFQYKSKHVLVDHISESVTSTTPAVKSSFADFQDDYNEEGEKLTKELQDKKVKEIESDESLDEFTFQDRELFTQRFQSMKSYKKWKLSTGTYVEDVLYNLGKKCRYHNLVHSFIIDPGDKFVQSGFTSDEITEIRETKSMYELPKIDDDLLEYIDSFAKDSTKDIRKALYSSHPRLCENYNPHVDFPYEHVRTTVSDWVRLLEMEPNPLTSTQDLPESWFRINVWRTIDIAFSDVPFVFFVGGEKAGLATKDRKNRGRTLSNIASDAGSKWEGEQGTKTIKECGLSLPKVLKDIFISLARKVDFDEDKMRKINIPGFIHAGANLIKTNLDCPKGYVCRYMREAPLEIYADVKQFSRTLDALVSIIYAKLKILNTMEIVNYTTNSSDNLKRWKNPRRAEKFDIPDCHYTPKKRKVV